ncbi:PAS domain S-box protein [Deinococcus taeanensis]|uniref:sensor histidine kinase n=1 Tax=Deinococcus taeanensis TaxID=2737050 RepID=UPI001CDD4B92|nr:ATP-binding protein [Deinococcus taeanensis]UBV42157.1 PAS domain S-box protein [Deinococcus taeanensis]
MPDLEPPQESPLPLLEQRVASLEAELQASRQDALTLFTEAPVPYLLLTAQGRIQEVNRAASGLLGRSREVLIGRHFSQFLAPESQGSFELLLGQAVQHGLSRRGEAQLLHADGSTFEVLLDLDAEKVDGDFRRFRLVLTDITAYKQAHASLLDTTAAQQEQLAQHSVRIRELNQELEQVMTVFVQQLHQPLTRAMNFLGLARTERTPQEQQQALLHTEQAVQQVFALMASIDRYMQMRSMRVRLRPVDLHSVLKEVRKNAQPAMADRNVQLTFDPLPTLQGDPRALYLVLDEYIANALKFTKEREMARIHLRVKDLETEYHIGVEDNGTGFNMRQKDRLFRLFSRLHSSKVYEGSGVGLITVRRSCLRFGGRVWAEGKVDQGATFWFAWPKQPAIRD